MEFSKKTYTLLTLLMALSGCATPDQYDASTHVWCTFKYSVDNTNPDFTDEVYPGARFQDQDQTDHCIYQNASSYEEQREQLKKASRR